MTRCVQTVDLRIYSSTWTCLAACSTDTPANRNDFYWEKKKNLIKQNYWAPQTKDSCLPTVNCHLLFVTFNVAWTKAVAQQLHLATKQLERGLRCNSKAGKTKTKKYKLNKYVRYLVLLEGMWKVRWEEEHPRFLGCPEDSCPTPPVRAPPTQPTDRPETPQKEPITFIVQSTN